MAPSRSSAAVARSDAQRPPLPRTDASGAYDVGDLMSYLEQAGRLGMNPSQIADHLRVSRDRIAYLQNGGMRVLLHHAAGRPAFSEQPTERTDLK